MNEFIPNSFLVPNSVVDKLMSQMSGAEFKCYCAVIRKTKGWNKESDYISITQFMKVTGLSNRQVINACNRLVEIGLLKQEIGARNTKIFSINWVVTSEKSSQVTSEKSSQVTSEKSSHTKNNIKNKNNTLTGITKKSASAVDILADFGITGQLADDFITHRKNRKAPITVTAMKGFQREADKAQIPLAEALTMVIERGWRGFNASWDWRGQSGGAAKTSTYSAAKPQFSDENTTWWQGETIEIYGVTP